ncbi:phosphate ABC transporter ATP-binding protein PstB [Methanosphaera sp. ISO3-F5]|uniref:phosphate ABC transporter ATP-binding protein PstB n=1 Tax=Methanosphaera sp. ISO3-F5 TaxID=1452353 RepID=UPI002B256A11|nr:phosphate ABC transporter ATP-binding protein PstB [Methanosphaera sp. ISO3-F5]WQH63763.1 phosphate ABC transporter ATP-binding protein PstB [Methanosphaera sp. ISO3-F5]
MSEILNVRDLNTYFDDKQILKDVNTSFLKNKVTALIGPSGCGKSTFLRSINRMNDLTKSFRLSGEILFDGKNIYDDDVDVISLRKKIGMVFQKATPFSKSIYENVAYGLRVQGVSDEDVIRERVVSSLRSAALWDEVQDDLDKSALKLSGGQQQRLCIARTIAVNPEIVLMDEPCSALDPVSTRRIEDLIFDLKKEYTIIIVTHNMQQAKRVSDYTTFFLDGCLVESDITSTIFSNPRFDKTLDYINGKFG